MGKYFVKQELEDKPGEFEYVEVDDNELEVPDAVVTKSKIYKEVVESDIRRRKKIKDLNEALSKATADKPDEDEVAPSDEKPADQKPQLLDEDALFEKFQKRLNEQATQRQQQEAELNSRLAKVAKDNGLGANAVEILRKSNDPEELAKLLAAQSYRFDDSVGGAPSEADKDALMNNVLKELGLGE